MAVAVATVTEVAQSLGRSISAATEIAQVQLWLDDAEMQIRLRLGDVGLLDQSALAFVEREAAILKVRNPDGSVISESIDDYSVKRSDDGSRGQVTILDEWWDLLSPNGTGGSFSIRPYSETYVAAAASAVAPDWDIPPWVTG